MGQRSKARECALQILYQWAHSGETMERTVGLFWQVRSGTDPVKAMAERLARGAQRELGRIDAAIAGAATHWRFERLADIDRELLRVAAYELLFEPQTPGSVVIDEAVELAKRFGEADSPAFVNGVLDAVMRKARGEGRPRSARKGTPGPGGEGEGE